MITCVRTKVKVTLRMLKKYSLEDLKDIINFQTVGDDNVAIDMLVTDDHWLNKLVCKDKFVGEMKNPTPDLHGRFMVEKNNHDEKYIDPKYKVKKDFQYPSFNPDTLWNECKHVLDVGKCVGKRDKKQQHVPTKSAGNKGKEQVGVKGKEQVGEKGKEPSKISLATKER
nr:hypothetical protein [Tanacetum cinerariifolium]